MEITSKVRIFSSRRESFIASCFRFIALIIFLGFMVTWFFNWYCPSPESLGYTSFTQEDSSLYVPIFMTEGAQIKQIYKLTQINCTQKAFHAFSLDCYLLYMEFSKSQDGLTVEYFAKKTSKSTDYYYYSSLIKSEVIGDTIIKRPMSVTFQDAKVIVSYEYQRQNQRLFMAVLYCLLIVVFTFFLYFLVRDNVG